MISDSTSTGTDDSSDPDEEVVERPSGKDKSYLITDCNVIYHLVDQTT